MGQSSAAAHLPDFTFGINQELPALDPGWQTFPGHYLLYASQGTFTLAVADRQWLLPPQRAAWVAADVLIRVRATGPITSSSILFARGSIPPPAFDCRVFEVTPLAREMILYAMRWGMTRDPQDRAAENFFAAVAAVCAELAATPEQFWLPRARSGELSCAMDHILTHLDARLTLQDVARNVNVSPRTLARRFDDEAQLTCGQFIRRVRLLRAMELLAQHDALVIEVAYAVGFASVSAFTSAFHRFTGETPSQYRRRFLPR
jgi:AraC-like DNA-binding protein